MIKYRRGDVEMYQIVMTILAILGLIIALLFWYNFKDAVDVSDEACKISVLTRATAPDDFQGLVPLKCQTKKLCITEKSVKECSQFLGEENVMAVKLDGRDDIQKARQIEQTIAYSMYTCWSMMGEGKLDLFNGKSDPVKIALSQVLGENVRPVCVICSRVALGKDLTDTESGQKILEKVDVRRYLENNVIPGQDITYLQYFTDRQFDAYPAELKAGFTKPASEINTTGISSENPTNQLAIIFMQILTRENPSEEAAENALTTGVIVGGSLLSVKNINPAKWTYQIGATLVSAGLSYGITFYKTYQNQETAVSYCGEYTSAEDARYGCSTLNTIDYRDVNKINNICSVIEGSP